MTIQFTCPHCGKQTNAGDQFAGQMGPCGGCGQMITIPFPSGGLPNATGYPQPQRAKSSSGVVIAVIAVAAIFGLFVCGGILVALLLPAVQAAREAARRTSCNNNLRQIALAMDMYHSANNAYPPAFTTDSAGKPLHSWRVLLLPYLGDDAGIYQQLKLNEPWDSEHNRQFANLKPRAYGCPSDPNKESGFTSYVVITGQGTIFEGSKSSSITDMFDGTANTTIAVEVEDMNIHWMEPRDLDIEAFVNSNGGPGGAGGKHPSGSLMAMADGSVQFLSNNVDARVKRALATRAGGEPIGEF